MVLAFLSAAVVTASSSTSPNSNAAVALMAVACAILLGSLFVAGVDFWDYVRKTHRNKLLNTQMQTMRKILALEEHLNQCPFELRVEANAKPSLQDVIRLVRACELTLAWTGILPFVCYLVAGMLTLATDLITAQIPAAQIGIAVFASGFVLQVTHHVIAYRLKLYEILYSLNKRDTPYGPIEGYVRKKIGMAA